MSWLAAAILCAALEFQPQEVPGVYVGALDPISGAPSTNFLQRDMDGDGSLDLLLQDALHLQRNNGFPPEARAPYPQWDQLMDVDAVAGTLFALGGGRLEIHTWSGSGWNALLEQDLLTPAVPAASAATGSRLQRFLHDFEDDGTPEIVLTTPEAVMVYARRNESYVESGRLSVLPPLQLLPPQDQTLWPQQSRELELPSREMMCRFYLAGASLVLVQQRPLDQAAIFEQVVYQVEQHAGSYTALEMARENSRSLPEFLRACRLNSDEEIDYVGGRWQDSKASVFPLPVYETWVTVDGGASYKIVRAPSIQRFRPHCSLLDIDGDGDRDLIAESTAMFRSGPRELITQLLTRQAINHLIDIYLQGPEGFDEAARFRTEVKIELESVPYRNGPMFQRYQLGELVDLSGDFNGDGLLDLLVREKSDSIRIFLSRGDKYAADPQQPIQVPANEDVRVYDLNGDGFSDLLLQARQTKADAAPRLTVYFTRKAAQ